jgi:hypothetical protein
MYKPTHWQPNSESDYSKILLFENINKVKPSFVVLSCNTKCDESIHQISKRFSSRNYWRKDRMSVINLAFSKQCRDFIERKLENDENSQEYKEDQDKYRVYVNSSTRSNSNQNLSSLQLYEPVDVKVSARVLGFVITNKTN